MIKIVEMLGLAVVAIGLVSMIAVILGLAWAALTFIKQFVDESREDADG